MRVALNNASAAFYFLCPPGQGYCNSGKCVFGRTEAVPKGSWATCAPLHNCAEVTIDGGGCFPAEATVKLPGGRTKRMAQLRVGDKVLAAAANGRLEYQEVYFFGHRSQDVEAAFVRIELDGGATLELTPDHFVPVLQQRRSGDGNAAAAGALDSARMTYARDVRVGDRLMVAAAGAGAAPSTAAPGKLRVAEVRGIESVRRQGLFNPYTMGGSIVVDGVLASSHSSWLIDGVAQRLGAAHLLPAVFQALFAPLRVLYAAVGADTMEVIGAAVAEAALGFETVLLSRQGLGAAAAAAAPTAAAAVVAAAAAAVVVLKRRLRVAARP